MRHLFVDDLGAHARRYSVLALGLLLALPEAWAAVPEEVKAHLPPWFSGAAVSGVALAGFVGAFLKQPLARDQFGLPPARDQDAQP